jgi:hypothetical protein
MKGKDKNLLNSFIFWTLNEEYRRSDDVAAAGVEIPCPGNRQNNSRHK